MKAPLSSPGVGQRLHSRGELRHLESGVLVARVSCFLVIRDIGRWHGSLTVLEEYEPLTQLWFQGIREYLLEFPAIGGGTVALSPLEWLDPVARASYTFRGLSLAPT